MAGGHPVHLQNMKDENWPGATPGRKKNLVGSVGNKGVIGNKQWTHKSMCYMISTLMFWKGQTYGDSKRISGCKGF